MCSLYNVMMDDIYNNINLKPGAQKWIHCNYCKVRTHHEMKAVHRSLTWVFDTVTMDVLEEAIDLEEQGYVEFRLWICLGCDTGLMEIVYNQGEPFPPEAEYVPSRHLHGIVQKEFRRLSPKLRTIYREVITSFNLDLNVLCAIGIRALLEGICKDKGVQGKNLLERIDGLKVHHLPENIVEHLHAFRFIGNEAAHELDAPNQYGLRECIEVLEDLLNFLYELEYKAARISRQKNRRKGS